jgi:NAD(P)-dependent dehydrogenase (short-subunit alcohol dehydrogenase family)
MYEQIFSCKNKVAIVTGGGGLIGKQIAQALADFGAKVYVVDIDPQNENPENPSPQISFLKINTTSEDEVKQAFKQISDKENRLDILVTCAYPRTKDWGSMVEDVPFDSWQENLNSQLGGTFICCREAAANMKMTGGGSIINMASTYGVVAPDFSIYEGTSMTMPVAYSAIKSGLIGLTRYFSIYYAKDNIRANSISPGGILDRQPDEFVNRYSKKTPLGRMGKASDIVGGVVFLASESSAYVTGQNLLIDGGWTAW